MVSGCSLAQASPGTTVVASTPIIADMVSNVGGDRITVTSLVPPGADPHTFEPTISSLKAIARADAGFSNALLLEDERLRRALDETLAPDAPHIGLAEAAVEYGAYHIPLVENAGLATTWVGFRVADENQTTFRVEAVRGPGNLISFTTGTFGQVSAWQGGPSSSGELALPGGSHTHMSWAFTAPGHYELDLSTSGGAHSTVHFAIGVDPGQARRVIDHGHLDITASGENLTLRGDDPSGTSYDLDPDRAIIAIPHTAATTIPADPQWRFVGRPGEPVWLVAQAVIGKHVHGEIDPHLWLDVDNAIAYVDVIEKNLIALDPEGGREYAENAEDYRAELRRLDEWMTQVIATIPNKRLVTTHDAYGYLARGYGMDVAGFVAPNASLEPSTQDLANLSNTLTDLDVPAVFIEQSQVGRASHLLSLAESHSIALCTLNADIPSGSYIDLMVANTHSLKTCLDPDSLPAWDY